MRSGCIQVVSGLAFYSDDPSYNPAKNLQFYSAKLYEKKENRLTKCRPELALFYTIIIGDWKNAWSTMLPLIIEVYKIGHTGHDVNPAAEKQLTNFPLNAAALVCASFKGSLSLKSSAAYR